MTRTPLRLAVFDCDGTLVDSQHSIVFSMHSACDALGIARSDEEGIRRVVGLPLLTAISRLVPEADAQTWERLRDRFSEAFRDLRLQDGVSEPLYPGVLEGLEAFEQAGWVLGVATGKSRIGLLKTLETHRLVDRFVTLQTSDLAPGKPNPDLLLRAMSEAGTEAPDTVMIGDTTFDMEMAVNAGTRSLGVAWGYHRTDELEAAGAGAIATCFDELPALALRLTAEPR